MRSTASLQCRGIAGSRIDQGLDGRFRSALGSLAINVRDIASIRLTDISETSSSKFTRSCAATLNVELKPGLWQKMTVFMGNPTSFDDRLQSDLMAIELTNQLHPEKINGGNISLNYTFDVRPDSKEPEVKTPLQEKSSAIYGDTLPMTIVEPYLRMSARALASVSTLPVQPVAAPTSLPAPAPLATPDTVASTPPTVDQGVSAARQEQVPQEATAAPTSHEAVQSTAPPVPPPVVNVSAAIRPSFNCALATTVIEHLICKDQRLAGLDIQLSNVYKNAAAASADKNVLRAAQLRWLTNERNRCTTVECLSTNYEQRISTLMSGRDE